MNRISKILISLVISALFTSFISININASTYYCNASFTGYVYSGDPSANYNSEQCFRIGGDSDGEYWSLARFVLTNLPSDLTSPYQISSVYLQFFAWPLGCGNPSGSIENINFHLTNNDWAPSTLNYTWVISYSGYNSSYTIGNTYGYFTSNINDTVTNAIKQKLINSQTDISILLKPSSSITNYLTYYRNTFPAMLTQYPKLQINYATLSTNCFSGQYYKGSSLSVPFTAEGFLSGNTFIAELSNASGNFDNPVIIGSVNGTTNGSILATIPANTPSGTGYRIRVKSSNPQFIGSDNCYNLTIMDPVIQTLAITDIHHLCSSFNINFTAEGFLSGNQFTAELSDASGNFDDNPPTIGSIFGTTGGSIEVVIPPLVTIPSSGYKIRVKGSNPPVIGSSSDLTLLPSIPMLISPGNTNDDISINPIFEWNTACGASTYNLQISNNNSFENILINQTGLNGTNYNEGILNHCSEYYWRVESVNGNLSSGWCEPWSFSTENITHNINLNIGWNFISSNIEPENSLIITMFQDISQNVNIMFNHLGQIYFPNISPPIDQINNWNFKHAYKIHMNNQCILPVIGCEVIPEENIIDVPIQWSFIPYLRNSPMNISTALSSISQNLNIVKDNSGGIYVPIWGINTIGNMQVGQGYQIHLTTPSSLTYPANSAQKSVSCGNITPLAKQLIPQYKNTGNSSTLILELVDVENGNEIGVYNLNDELIGSGAVHNGIAAITIWGDDEITNEVDGALNNEFLTIKLLNSSNSFSNLSLFNLKEITCNTELDNLTYRTDAIYTAKASVAKENSFSFSINCLPNPTSSNTTFEFYLTEESEAEIEIYTLTGGLVMKIGQSNYSAGIHRVNFEASQLSNGIYNVILRSGNQRAMTLLFVEE